MSEKDLQKQIADLNTQIKKLQKNRLGLVFEEKREDVVDACERKVPILRESTKKRVLNSSDLDHLLIEGDNYHSLCVLNYTHRKSIDLIYIDPPYNTGARNWKYNNDYVDKEDEYRHSKWLSMMRNRLRLAKNLLKEDGVLICAIDENEQAHLSVLIEQIFTSHNQHTVTVIHNPKGVQGNNFSYTHEYAIFVVPKDSKTIGNRALSDEEIYVSNLRNWGNESERSDAKNCFYPIFLKDNQIVGFGDVAPDNIHPSSSNEDIGDGVIAVWPIDEKGIERKWRYARQSVEEIKDILQVKKGRSGILQIMIAKDYGTYKTVWTDKKYEASEYGTKLLREIVPNCDFDFPKSLYTVFDCIYAVVGDKPNAIILDFFAGSGTTGHAVLEMNKKDNGKRKFILCTNNENNICEDVTYPRVKNVIQGYKGVQKSYIPLLRENITWSSITKDKSRNSLIESVETIVAEESANYQKIEKKIEDGDVVVYGINEIKGKIEGIKSNLYYYKTDLIDIEHLHKISDEARIKVTYQAGEMIGVREGTLNDVEKNDWWQIFESANKTTAIYFKEDKSKISELITKLEKTKKPVTLYIFSWGKNENKGEYSSSQIRIEDIPEPIIEVYKEINRL